MTGTWRMRCVSSISATSARLAVLATETTSRVSPQTVALDVFARSAVGAGEQLEPPLALFLRAGLAAVAEVGLADDADHPVVCREHGDGADAMANEHGGNRGDRRIWPHRDHVLRHGFERVHDCISDTPIKSNRNIRLH